MAAGSRLAYTKLLALCEPSRRTLRDALFTDSRLCCVKSKHVVGRAECYLHRPVLPPRKRRKFCSITVKTQITSTFREMHEHYFARENTRTSKAHHAQKHYLGDDKHSIAAVNSGGDLVLCGCFFVSRS
jgi:hypothetical protein